MKAILFDLGGVLIDLAPSRVFEHWGNTAAVPASTLAARWKIDAAYKAHETGEMEFVEFTGHLQTLLGISMTQNDWQTGWNALLGQPFPGVLSRLSKLKNRIPLYCFSNTNQTHWSALTARANHPPIESFFQQTYLSYAVGRRKPNIEAYDWVANDMGYRPTDVTFLDDNEANVLGAQQAGLETIHATKPRVTIDFLDNLLV
ncbi:MAG: HAD family phosphatase [Pseudomonadales bacterium]|nr:HAD family phosphatase [Pseudomonadales bacterium]